MLSRMSLYKKEQELLQKLVDEIILQNDST